MFFFMFFSFWLSLEFPEYFCRTLFQDFLITFVVKLLSFLGGGPGAQVSFVVSLDSGFLQLIHKIMIIHWNSRYSILSETPDTSWYWICFDTPRRPLRVTHDNPWSLRIVVVGTWMDTQEEEALFRLDWPTLKPKRALWSKRSISQGNG